mmetsp:Transcript_37725/g.97331  ORF Transcript_37725/g.97331 Transcript_37725/m.97331 type:complete len:261 (-) Transcript_37725:304-1086(-)|eukprot:CAMPEP_0113909132 /NCGR_PEP_ID=MMETSP0780_2-20120614/26628_1 /TAXON_ID=652834 /ORGANISM="Palpitomonas bilix" /LENGTH=260 /DNA_ID=CAMNT_0000904799 /DNA_START=377 /DNA_END=1159 /DNA_ORIENTATION=- /assembly_acc=CAM_ASM_000599
MFRSLFNSPSAAAQTAQRFFQSLRIILVRHGKSEGNVDPVVWQTTADHAIGLCEEGKEQARHAGEILRAYYESNPLPTCLDGRENPFEKGPCPDLDKLGRAAWVSPYARTRQTADGIMSVCEPLFDYRKDHIGLVEQQFGLFEGIPDEELPIRFPAEYRHYMKCNDFGGRFWARYPLGESRFDVAMRVHQVFEDLYHNADKHRDILIVTHGVTLRAFMMMFLKKTPEWFEEEPNPGNCALRLIECGEDKGYLFEGFHNHS